MKVRLFYFSELPFDVIMPSGAKRMESDSLVNKYRDFKQEYGYDAIESLREKGQLDPNIGYWNGRKWVIEPGQTRWFALCELGKKVQRVLIKVLKNEEEQFFKYFKKYSYREICNIEEAIPLFKNTKWEDHRGFGYLRRRGWLEK